MNLEITKEAECILINAKKNNKIFRLEVNSGGCNGYISNFQIVDFAKVDPNNDLLIPNSQGCTCLVIDKESFNLIKDNFKVNYKDSIVEKKLFLESLGSPQCSCKDSFVIEG